MTKSNTRAEKIGLPPGSLIHIGERKVDEIAISIHDYNANEYHFLEPGAIEETFLYKDTKNVSWINIDGLHDVSVIEAIGNHFELHPLLLEDILNANQRPKLEEFDNCIFISMKMLGLAEDQTSIIKEQISFVLGNNWLLSFQEEKGDIFGGLRGRLKLDNANIRKKGNDYLLYRLIDTVIDNYFIITDSLRERAEELEEKALYSTESELLHEIQELRKQLIGLRRVTSPLRDIVIRLEKDDIHLIKKTTSRYLHDVYEHILQINESLDHQREVVASIMDLYQTNISNKMNQVMKVLTIIATIFIPLTFIAGVYGMNFEYMPELKWRYGYVITLGVMFVTFVVMLIFMLRKKWL